MYGGYSSPPITNNPFIADTTTGAISSRYPDLSSPLHLQQQQQQYGAQGQGWGNDSMMGGGTPGGYPQQQQGMYQQQQYPQQGYGQPQQHQMSMNTGMGGMGMGGDMGGGYLSAGQYPSHQQQTGGSHFQPTSSFGQQLAAQVPISGSSYSYLQGGQQQQQPQRNTYNPAQQQMQSNPGYVAQLDPYGPLAQWDGSNTQQLQQQQQQQQQQQFGASGMMQQANSYTGLPVSGGSYGTSPAGEPHPRDYIRTHKAEIEAWDGFAWKQFLGSFEALMKAWESRKSELARRVDQLKAEMNRGLGYGDANYVGQIQLEGSRIAGLQKEAEENYDSVTASTFQMQEVFEGYRQSSDLAGKSRVREATNAALHALPGWPQPY